MVAVSLTREGAESPENAPDFAKAMKVALSSIRRLRPEFRLTESVLDSLASEDWIFAS